MYKVIQPFVDGENGKPFTKAKGGVPYEPGDTYPKEGIEQSARHIKYLLACNFRGNGPVIEEVRGITGEKRMRTED